MSAQNSPNQVNGEAMPATLPISNDTTLTMITAANISDYTPEIIRHINGDPEVRASIHWLNLIATKEQIEAHYTSHPRKGDFQYALSVAGTFAGTIGLMQREGLDNGTEVSFSYSLDPPFRRRGLVSRGMQTLMEYAEGALRPSYFTLYISDDNLKSQRVARSNGFLRTKGMYETDSGKIERRYERRLMGA